MSIIKKCFLWYLCYSLVKDIFIIKYHNSCESSVAPSRCRKCGITVSGRQTFPLQHKGRDLLHKCMSRGGIRAVSFIFYVTVWLLDGESEHLSRCECIRVSCVCVVLFIWMVGAPMCRSCVPLSDKEFFVSSCRRCSSCHTSCCAHFPYCALPPICLQKETLHCSKIASCKWDISMCNCISLIGMISLWFTVNANTPVCL